MSQLTDQHYLQTEQYKDASNLNARARLHRRFSTNDYEWQHWVFDRLDLPECCDVLDVGCGPGDLWVENEDRIPTGWTIVLSDLSPGMLHRARHNLVSSRHRSRYCILDAQAIPFPDESFDAVVANHMLYHVPDRERALSEIHRVLRPGAHVYAATNGLNHLRELRDLVDKFRAQAETPNAAAEFGLEDGAGQLSRHFAHITVHRQENALAVTEAEPLIGYARSMMPQSAWRQNGEALGQAVRKEIAAAGVIHIQKDAGLFEAVRA